MHLSTERAQLQDIMKNLRVRWEATQEVWKDAVQQQFAEEYWEPLEPNVRTALRAIDQLGQVFTQVRRDCS